MWAPIRFFINSDSPLLKIAPNTRHLMVWKCLEGLVFRGSIIIRPYDHGSFICRHGHFRKKKKQKVISFWKNKPFFSLTSKHGVLAGGKSRNEYWIHAASGASPLVIIETKQGYICQMKCLELLLFWPQKSLSKPFPPQNSKP